ncbi:MAG: homoprotocatechuate degradation operon regulator HpaR [Ancalomicrobiaceae bacterium]|nr:homoprotocatechuate degradation operon regulator HpaR [Ancalomicrobiaceae bacterium]
MSLLRAREAVMRQFRPGLMHFGLTEQQWRVLRALTAVREIEVSALAEATFLIASSLSRILKGLDERGLILRRAVDEDMRRGLVSISPKGEELIETAGAYSERIYAEITRRFGVERLAALQEMLRDLEALLPEDEFIAETLHLVANDVDAGPVVRRGRPKKSGIEEE